ncbi:AMP-binding protein [Nocardioides dongxiaopingii]|uniref:AMP-binding protein n=1 Tax=Nocardioides dongxiaopingii TaxID=2576036 RepID=UPI0010C767E6|nr:AMP-binding protein [Nocardioides dongxiaopingii]
MDVPRLRAWLAAPGEPEPLVVETSGSSGTPKRVVLSRRAVLASVAASADRLGGTGPWALRLPLGYVAGLQVVCRSLVAGHEPLTDPTRWPDGEGWFTSLVPTQLHRILEDADPTDRSALARAHTVLLGGGPVDPALRAGAAAAGVRVVTTYGAAETAGGCVYDGVPLDGVTVDLDASGRIRLGGPTLFDRYDGDPDLTAQTLVDGWFLTADAGRLGPDGRLEVLGRTDDVVVSGGVNVPGPAVAARLRAHPGVAAAEVLGVPDEEWGNRLVAFVALADAARDVDATALRAWVAAAHPRAWAPRQVVVLDAIPLLANGKADRLRLRELAR